MNETGWHRRHWRLKRPPSSDASGARWSNSLNGFHQRVTCACEVSRVRRFRRNHRSCRYDGPAARAVCRSGLARDRGRLEGRPHRLARVHGAPDRPGAREPGRRWTRSSPASRSTADFRGFARLCAPARPQRHDRVRRARPHDRGGARALRPRPALLCQSPAMAGRRPLAPDLPACAQRLPSLVGQLQVPLHRRRSRGSCASSWATAARTSASPAAPTWCWPRAPCSTIAGHGIYPIWRLRISTRRPCSSPAGSKQRQSADIGEPAARAED